MSKATRHSHSLLERLRKPISRVIAAFFIAVLVFTLPANNPWAGITMEALGLLLVVAAVLGRLWCALYIAGHKDAALRVDGPYSACRNPLYYFSFLGLIGVTLFAQMGLLTLIVAPLFLLYYHYVITGEEARLKQLFGAEYESYLNKVPRFWPDWRKYESREVFQIEPARMIKATKDVIWFFIAVIFLGVVKNLHVMGVIPTFWNWWF